MATLLRKYDCSAAGKSHVLNNCSIVLLQMCTGEDFYIPIEYSPPNFVHSMEA